MKTNYEIAIPSYDRPETLLKKTLAYLEQTNVRGRITVFLASKQQRALYTGLPKEIRVVVGVPTLMQQRRFISKFYPPGTRLFNIEDDIPGIFYAPTPKRLEMVKDLHSLIDTGFSICERAKTKLWGVAASSNPFFIYRGGVSTDLKFIDGAVFGTINEHDKKLWTTLPVKEDYQRTILYYLKYGSVVRFNGYAMKNNTYTEKGGLKSFRTVEDSKWCAEYLVKNYPSLVRLNTKRVTKGWTEILLIKQ